MKKRQAFFALCQYRISENIWRYLCWWANLFGENENKVVLVSKETKCYVFVRFEEAWK